MPLSEVRHQRPALRLVQRALSTARLPHAYLFHGPEGVGKEMFAQRLAQLLLCENPQEFPPPELPELAGWAGPYRDACGQCRSCHLARVDNHPDIHVIHRMLKALHPEPEVRKRSGATFVIDVVRHFIIDAVGLASVKGRGKVFIVREADRMTDQAQNALLKTLEEPPRDTFLILITSSAHLLLSTTRSRCQQVPFGTLPAGFVAELLAAGGLAPDEARFYASLSEGSAGLAKQYAADDLRKGYERVAAELASLNRPRAMGAAKVFLEVAKKQAEHFRERDEELSEAAALRQALGVVFLLAAHWYRGVLHAQNPGAGAAHTPVEPAAVQRIGLASAAEAISLLAGAERQFDFNVNSQLAVDALAIRLAALHERPEPAAAR